MATIKLPSYVQTQKLADGKRAYYWVRPTWAAPPAERHGKLCPVESAALGTDAAAAIKHATSINAAFADWRKGQADKLIPGSVRWLFAWYREDERYTSLRYKTRKGYREMMDAVQSIAMKHGIFADRLASSVDATVADKLYKRARSLKGERQASYMMQVCRLVWNQAARHAKATGVKANPFAGMGIKSSSGQGRGNRAATRAEYDLYRAAARAMGKQSMATAAALCFEGCQRVWDVFGFVDPDHRVERGIHWSGYRPGVELKLIQSKTGNLVEIPLVDVIDGESVELYPELEEELARTPRSEADSAPEMIVRDERTGQPYTIDYMPKLHRRIRAKAGLPADLRFTSFRHGGITEIGDSGSDDVRAVTGHSTLEVTRIYNKANVEKARKIATKRREHIKLLADGDDGNKE